MRLATSKQSIQHGLAGRFAPRPAPTLGFAHPREVLKHPGLTPGEKRAVLSSWASDASALEDEPCLRWLLGTPEPVAFTDVRAALIALDGAGVPH